MKFQGKLGEYKVITTQDGSKTLWSEAFKEHCHSNAGASSETKHNFIYANSLLKKLERTAQVSILEIGFGTGLGYQTIAETIENNFNNKIIKFISLELDETLIEWAKKQNYPKLQNHPNICQLQQQAEEFKALAKDNELRVIVGDATQSVKKLTDQFDFIFQDAFSPKKNPTLWTTEWFQNLYLLAKPGAILTTYSSARQVRNALSDVGWKVESIAGFAHKKEITKAVK